MAGVSNDVVSVNWTLYAMPSCVLFNESLHSEGGAMRGDDAGRRKILYRPTTRGGKDVWRLCIDGELVTWRTMPDAMP